MVEECILRNNAYELNPNAETIKEMKLYTAMRSEHVFLTYLFMESPITEDTEMYRTLLTIWHRL